MTSQATLPHFDVAGTGKLNTYLNTKGQTVEGLIALFEQMGKMDFKNKVGFDLGDQEQSLHCRVKMGYSDYKMLSNVAAHCLKFASNQEAKELNENNIQKDRGIL